MAKPKSIKWLDDPEQKDYLAVRSFLGMIIEPRGLEATIGALHHAPEDHWAAKDLLRGAGLPPLRAKQSAGVAEKLGKPEDGVAISPVLVVMDDVTFGGDGPHD